MSSEEGDASASDGSAWRRAGSRLAAGVRWLVDVLRGYSWSRHLDHPEK